MDALSRRRLIDAIAINKEVKMLDIWSNWQCLSLIPDLMIDHGLEEIHIASDFTNFTKSFNSVLEVLATASIPETLKSIMIAAGKIHEGKEIVRIEFGDDPRLLGMEHVTKYIVLTMIMNATQLICTGGAVVDELRDLEFAAFEKFVKNGVYGVPEIQIYEGELSVEILYYSLKRLQQFIDNREEENLCNVFEI
ncbi:hypothetical protein HK098_004654 [Nowakowskiella sp. JEL0407]|nr:hypothetical protein HK098_004654 [Nowakowskiella sp. JEL0407]